jgi:hypothetical protein
MALDGPLQFAQSIPDYWRTRVLAITLHIPLGSSRATHIAEMRVSVPPARFTSSTSHRRAPRSSHCVPCDSRLHLDLPAKPRLSLACVTSRSCHAL